MDFKRRKLPLKKPSDIVELGPPHIDILFDFAKLGKRDVFYDLGSGRGNLVFSALNKYKVRKSVGIELEKSLYDISRRKLDKIKTKGSIEFIHGEYSAFDYEDRYFYDVSDATVVFNSLEPSEEEVTFYLTQFHGKRVKILKKDMPLVGFRPVAMNKENDGFWFYCHQTPLGKHRVHSKREWAESVLQENNVSTRDVYNYFRNQLRKRRFRRKTREESIDSLKKLVWKFLPDP